MSSSSIKFFHKCQYLIVLYIWIILYCIYIIHFFHSPIDGHLSWFHVSSLKNNVTISMGVHLSLRYADSILFGHIYVFIYLPIYLSISRNRIVRSYYWSCLSLYKSICYFLDSSHTSIVRGYFFVVLIYISLITHNIGYFPCIWWPCTFFLRSIYSDHFKLDYFILVKFFCALYILWILSFVRQMVDKYFLIFCRLFPFLYRSFGLWHTPVYVVLYCFCAFGFISQKSLPIPIIFKCFLQASL
jgi:hypothetical protein